VRLPREPDAPVRAAARLLERFGVEVSGARGGDPDGLRLTGSSGRSAQARLGGWTAGQALRPAPASGSVLTAYAALRLAGVAVAGVRTGGGTELRTTALRSELAGPVHLRGSSRPEMVRCRDGWAVIRWREDGERELLRALVGATAEQTRADVVAQGRLARLLIAPVAPPPASRPMMELGSGATAGGRAASRRRPRIVDWSVLWAGPWAAGQLRHGGAVVQRIEHPRRRDGLLGWPQGRRWWRRLNEHKQITLLDAQRRCDRDCLAGAIRQADLLVTSMTPRALRSLGFDDDWREENAPDLLHLELVAFEEPWGDSPGLGEHAAAQAGLLWREGRPPARPYPWADPLLGASALALAQIWLSCGSPPGGRVRLSLERAASLAFAAHV
jgi:hypothetical protein